MILLLPLLRVLLLITLLFSLWLVMGGTLLFAVVSVTITALMLIRQQGVD